MSPVFDSICRKIIVTGADLQCNTQLTHVDLKDNVWHLTMADGKTETCQNLVLTFPAPQLLGLQGTIAELLKNNTEVKEKLRKVEYSSRFSLGLFYPAGTKIDLPWAAKYVDGDSCIRYVSIDNRKRGQESAEVGPSVLVHTSVPFGLKHLEEDKETVCREIVYPRFKELFPSLPEASSMKCHKWRFSQVYKYYEGKPGCVVLHNDPPLILGGDLFSRSRFDGCIDSAVKIVEELQKHQTSNKL